MIEVNGQFPTSDELILGTAKQAITRKAGDLICPEHQKEATLTFAGERVRDLSVNINACCDKFREVVSKRIRG